MKNVPIDSAYIIKQMKKHADKKKIRVLSSFFKTAKGQYGEGDVFIGVTVPYTRKVAKSVASVVLLDQVALLLKNPVHEYRLCGLLILVYKIEVLYRAPYKKAIKVKDVKMLAGIEQEHKVIADFYLTHLPYVNNWDLVDQSAPHILGSYLYMYQRTKVLAFLKQFAISKNLWVRRVAMLATFYGIQKFKLLDEAFAIAEMLLRDEHDLIQKAVGWMLREAGKRDEKRLKVFLNIHASGMPRTALRYAIERLGIKDKGKYMAA